MADGDRWFRIADLASVGTGALDRVLRDLETTRAYRDGKAQGGGLSLFISSAAVGVVLRAFEGRPFPVLLPCVQVKRLLNARQKQADVPR